MEDNVRSVPSARPGTWNCPWLCRFTSWNRPYPPSDAPFLVMSPVLSLSVARGGPGLKEVGIEIATKECALCLDGDE